MKSVGIIRNVDNLGRVVIPKEMRKEFQLIEHEPVEIEGVKLCKKCLDKIRNF